MSPVTKTNLIVVGILLLVIGFASFVVMHTSNKIEEAGGVEQIIIDAGKAMKDIGHELDKYDPSAKKGPEAIIKTEPMDPQVFKEIE